MVKKDIGQHESRSLHMYTSVYSRLEVMVWEGLMYVRFELITNCFSTSSGQQQRKPQVSLSEHNPHLDSLKRNNISHSTKINYEL